MYRLLKNTITEEINYASFQLPNLGKADHSLIINLVPQCRQIVQRAKPRIFSVQRWEKPSVDHLMTELSCSERYIIVSTRNDVLTQTVITFLCVLKILFHQSKSKCSLAINHG